jgi:hypothetical protein
MVGALPAYAADEPFRVTARTQCPGRDLDCFHPLGGEHPVEGGGELRVAVADEEPERRCPVAEVPTRFRPCWVVHSPLGFAVTPRMCARRVTTSMTTRTYRRRSAIVSTCRKSAARSHVCALRNVRQLASLRRGAGAETRAGEDSPNRGGAHPMPQGRVVRPGFACVPSPDSLGPAGRPKSLTSSPTGGRPDRFG